MPEPGDAELTVKVDPLSPIEWAALIRQRPSYISGKFNLGVNRASPGKADPPNEFRNYRLQDNELVQEPGTDPRDLTPRFQALLVASINGDPEVETDYFVGMMGGVKDQQKDLRDVMSFCFSQQTDKSATIDARGHDIQLHHWFTLPQEEGQRFYQAVWENPDLMRDAFNATGLVDALRIPNRVKSTRLRFIDANDISADMGNQSGVFQMQKPPAELLGPNPALTRPYSKSST